MADLLTIDEARAELRCGRSKLYVLIGRGSIRVTKIGGSTFIKRSELDRYLKAADDRRAA